MDPSVRAWLGFLDVIPFLSGDEYLALISSYQPSTSALTNRAKFLERQRKRLSEMPPREELEAYLKTHSHFESCKHFGVSSGRMYEWKTALGIVRAYR